MKHVHDYLREERLKQQLTLEEVENATKIKKEFLSAIEGGRLHKLPSQAYALGFVKTYASYLGLPEQKILALFRRDYAEQGFEVVPSYRKNQHKFNRAFFVSTRGVITLLTVLLITGYIIFQYGPLLFGPRLSVTSPKNGSVLKENVVEVSGKTDPYATVSIDQDDAYVDVNGNFKKSVYLFSGERKITILAKNRFGKETREAITVKVE